MNGIHELLESLVAEVFNEFRQRFRAESAFDSPEEVRLRASAWYLVTYRLNQNQTQKFFGFPFTISDELCKIVDTSGHQVTASSVRDQPSIVSVSQTHRTFRPPPIDKTYGYN